MATGHAQENQSTEMEGNCTPLSAATSGVILTDDVPPRAILECHICMDAPTDPVATSCGHIFCWPCLSQWFQNSLKPCPICRKLLSRKVNILALHHGAGDAAATARASPGNDSAGTGAAAAAGSVPIPPRPANPLLFVPRESGSSPESELSDSMAIVRAIGELVRERSHGRRLALELARQKPRLKQRMNELLRRNSDLTQDTKRMGLHIAQLKRRLAVANEQLPSG